MGMRSPTGLQHDWMVGAAVVLLAVHCTNRLSGTIGFPNNEQFINEARADNEPSGFLPALPAAGQLPAGQALRPGCGAAGGRMCIGAVSRNTHA